MPKPRERDDRIPEVERTLLVIGAVAAGTAVVCDIFGFPGAAAFGVAAGMALGIDLGVWGFDLLGIWRGPACFVAGTPVLMGDLTSKPIETVAPNDLVLSRNEVTGATEARRVSRLFVHDVGNTLRIVLANGEVIETTDAHRFNVAGGAFVRAASIAVGAKLTTYGDRGADVILKEPVAKRTRVYNLGVEDFHTYFVSDARVCVHNLKDDDGDEP